MAILRSLSKRIEQEHRHLEARLHPSYLMLGDALDAVIEAGGDDPDPARACLDAARGFGQDDTQRAGDAPQLIVDARDIEAFRAKAAAPGPIDHARDAAWWDRQIRGARERTPASANAEETQARGLRHAGELLGMPVALLERSRPHRESLLGLPELIGEGSAEDIAAWVAGELAEIDPAMSDELREEDPVLRSLLDEREGLLICMSYLGLVVEAVPSSVYARMAGPGAIHLLPQVVRLVGCSFLGARSAIVPIYELNQRLQAACSKPDDDPRLQAAMSQFGLHLDQFTTAAVELHRLGEELAARQAAARGGLAGRFRALFKR